MQLINITIIQKNIFLIFVLAIVLLQVLLVFQGFDVADDGFVLTFYQQIFNEPNSVEYNFNYYLGGIVGGVWNKFFGSFGVLGFRFLAILVNTATFIFSYIILNKYINRVFLLFGLSMALFITDYGFLTFYHNQLTALLAVVSVFFLHKGLCKDKNIYYLISGFVIAINVFTRVPNLTLFILIIVIPFKYYLEKKPLLDSLKSIVFFALGSISGFTFIYLILLYNDHISVVIEALRTLIALGGSTDNTHNLSKLIKVIILNNLEVLKVVLKLLLFFGLIYLTTIKKINNFKYKNESTLVFVFFILVYFFSKKNIFVLYGLGYIGFFCLIISKKINSDFKTLILLGVLIQVFLPLGSDGGIRNCGYISLWLTIPLFFKFIDVYKGSLTKYYPIIKLQSLVFVIIGSYFAVRIYKVSKEAYFDEGSRFDKTYCVENKLSKNIYTTKERASVINEVLENLDKFVEPNDYLFVYDSFPMLYYLTETKPYTYNPWVMIYDSQTFKNKLIKAQKEIKGLPVIVQQKFSSLSRFSPPIPNYMTIDRSNKKFYNNERNRAMVEFINKNNYEVVWSNSHFNIYKPIKVN